MPATILRGDEPAAALLLELRQQLTRLAGLGITPGLAIVQAGGDAASRSYVGRKLAAGEQLGLRVRHDLLPETCSKAELFAAVGRACDDPLVHGVIVQLPLPAALRGCEDELAAALNPSKDVDCFHPHNLGLLLRGTPRFVPATPAGIIYLLHHYRIAVAGKTVVILGRSLIVGRPLAVLLAAKGTDATVIQCHTATRDLPRLVRQAEILIAAAGKPGLVRGEMLAPGAVVVDVGTNRVADPDSPKGYRLAGDCDFASVSAAAAAVSPVPGGVGPLTVAMLLRNVVHAASARI